MNRAEDAHARIRPVENESKGKPAMKARLSLILVLCWTIGSVAAQSTVPQALADGLRAFEEGAFETALQRFETIRRDGVAGWDGHALFWSARTRMVLGRYDEAADLLDRFAYEYPGHPYLEESAYQRARIFHIQEQHEAAVQALTEFVVVYPASELYPNAVYWTGEAVFALGRLSEAERLFAEVVDRYPASFRAEAARYRLDVIDLVRRERELLTLLQWSHEEYLAAVESFQRRERSNQEALRSYRERLVGLSSDDFRQEIEVLHQRIAELEAGVDERDRRINELTAEIRQIRQEAVATPDPVRTDPLPAVTRDLEFREALLSLKEQALELQGLLLDQEREAE